MLEWTLPNQSINWKQGWIVLEQTPHGCQLRIYETLGGGPLHLGKGAFCPWIARHLFARAHAGESLGAVYAHELRVRPWMQSNEKHTLLLEREQVRCILRFEDKRRQERWAQALMQGKLRGLLDGVTSELLVLSSDRPSDIRVGTLLWKHFQALQSYDLRIARETQSQPILASPLNRILIFELSDLFLVLTLSLQGEEDHTLPLCTVLTEQARWRLFTDQWRQFVLRWLPAHATTPPFNSTNDSVLALLLCCDLKPLMSTYMHHLSVVERSMSANKLVKAMLQWAAIPDPDKAKEFRAVVLRYLAKGCCQGSSVLQGGGRGGRRKASGLRSTVQIYQLWNGSDLTKMNKTMTESMRSLCRTASTSCTRKLLRKHFHIGRGEPEEQVVNPLWMGCCTYCDSISN
jgi:hypothetical protein